MKTAQDFMKQSKTGIYHWNVDICKECGYRCGFRIVGDTVWYDNGCGCPDVQEVRESSWDEMADYYNKNANIENAEHWGFYYSKLNPQA